MCGLGVAGFGVLAVGWLAGSATNGVLRLVCRLLAVLGGIYGVYMIALTAGWKVVSRGLQRWMSLARLRAAQQAQESLLELRFGRAGDEQPSFVDALMDDLNAALDGAGTCEEIEVYGAGAVVYFMHGRDLDRMVAVARQIAVRFPLPQDAYLWVPSQTRRGFGTVLLARQD